MSAGSSDFGQRRLVTRQRSQKAQLFALVGLESGRHYAAEDLKPGQADTVQCRTERRDRARVATATGDNPGEWSNLLTFVHFDCNGLEKIRVLVVRNLRHRAVFGWPGALHSAITWRAP